GRLALHPLEHWVALAHWLLGQVDIAVALQAPAPLHTDALVSVPALHLAAVHTVWLSGYAQSDADVPSQNPAQVACVPLHAGRLPRGAPLTVRQVPTWLVSAQA